jgi:palmitoyl-[glycerolipid] 3-(E)-desaturase
VYKKRWRSVLYTCWGVSLYFATRAPSLPFFLIGVVLSAMYIDFYGAVLHIVLDHPPFIALPLIGEACMEFQWHHLIPHDITSRCYAAVAGDLNLVVPLSLILQTLWYRNNLTPKVMTPVILETPA